MDARRRKTGKRGYEIDNDDMTVLKAIEELKTKKGNRFLSYTDIIMLMKDLGWQPPKQSK